MRLGILAALLMGAFLLPAEAQYANVVFNRLGQPMAGAKVAICTSDPGSTTPPCSSLATTYTSVTYGTACVAAAETGPTYGTGCGNPGLTDAYGNYIIYLPAAGTYFAQIYGPTITTQVFPFVITTAGVVLDPSQYSGVDACARIATAIAALPSTGGTIDARSFQGTQACSVNPLASITKPVRLILGATTYSTDVRWNTGSASHVHVDGLGDGSLISASGSFPTSTAVVNMGDGATAVFDTQFNNLKIKCNGITGCSTMTASGLNDEQSGGSHLNLDGYMVNGLNIDGTGIITENFHFSDLSMGEQSTAVGAEGIVVNATGATGIIENVVIVPHAGAATQTSGVHVKGTGSNGIIALQNIHCETRADCVYFDTGTYGTVFGAELKDGTNVLHVNTVNQILATRLIVSGGTVTNIIQDDLQGLTCTDQEIPFYSKNRSNGVMTFFLSGETSTCGNLFGAAPRFHLKANSNSGTNSRSAIEFWNLQRDGWRIENTPDGTNAPITFRPYTTGTIGSSVWELDNAGLNKITAIRTFTTNPASVGFIRMAKTEAINFRNNGASADINGLSVSADVVQVGDTAGTNIVGPLVWNGQPMFVYVTGDFSTAANTNLQGITGLTWTMPGSLAVNIPFDCYFQYSQATAAVADSFGIQDVTTAPTQINANGAMQTNTTVFSGGPGVVALNSTTATAVMTATPSAITTVWSAEMHGVIEQPSGTASAINIMAKTSTAADVLTVKRGSYCRVGPK